MFTIPTLCSILFFACTSLNLPLLIHCQELALGSRVAPPLDAGRPPFQIRMFAESPPPSQGCFYRAATPPSWTHRGKVILCVGCAPTWCRWWRGAPDCSCCRLAGARQLLCIRVVVPPVAALALLQRRWWWWWACWLVAAGPGIVRQPASLLQLWAIMA